MTKILVTGAAGFIGAHLSKRLLEDGAHVVGIDNLNDYYDVSLKKARLEWISTSHQSSPAFTENKFSFQKLDLANREETAQLFSQGQFDQVIHLAAQAGVRHSITHPLDYIDSNFVGFAHVLEGCRTTGVKHLVYASSSSVYGANRKLPYSVHDNVDHPLSLYAASKKANELMAHSYSALYQLPTTGLRFFTVYGPWGRPDMAPILFTKKILSGETIDVFNHGNYSRDFTYIDDIVEGIVRVTNFPPQPAVDWNPELPDPARSSAPWRVYNIGNNQPVKLGDFISVLENELGTEAIKNYLPRQLGEVDDTWADISELESLVDYQPKIKIQQGVKQFVSWYKNFYRNDSAFS